VADNVTVDNGALTDYAPATDERTIAAVAVHVQRMGEIGNTSGASAQTTVTNSSTSIVAARETRKSATLLNLQTVAVYVDVSGGTATTSHFRLDPGASITVRTTAAITGITSAAYTASGDAKIHSFETFDT